MSFTRMMATYLVGGCNSSEFTKFFDSYISGYYVALEELDQDLIDQASLNSGSMKMLKHVHNMDLHAFSGISISSFRSLLHAKIPHFMVYDLPLTGVG